MDTYRNDSNRFVKSDGFVLILLILTLLAIGGAIVFTGIVGSSLSRERFDAEASATSDVLLQAKLSLLGYAARVTDGGNGYRLGNLPTPDILNTAATGILYDGVSDSNKCLGSAGGGLPGVIGGNANKRCLGKFPTKDLPLALGITDAHDPAGKVPWLAISPNLDFWDSCLNIVNSEVLNFAFTGFGCPTLPTLSTSLPYPWLTVYDKTGIVLSSRVVAVLIMPGQAISTETLSQVRTPSAPGLPTDYLDSIALPLGCTSGCVKTINNAGLTNEFVSIPAGTIYPSDAEDIVKRGQPIKFNDVVVYITIDEFIAFLEKRVLKEMASAAKELSDPAKKNIGFPWAAPYTSAPDSYAKFASAPGNVTGLFPFFVGVAASTPPLGYPSYQTDLNWTISGLSNPSKTCVQVQSGPNRWINTREGITSVVAASGASPLATTSCTWKGLGVLSCTGTITSNPTLTFQHFSSLSRCNAGTPVSGSPPTYTRTRTIALSMEATCSGTLTNSYLAASDTQPQSWSWNCTSAQALPAFTVDVLEDFATTTPPTTGSATFNGGGRPVTVTNMRYQPLMPYWFYQNEWYKTAFYALSPARRPPPGLIPHNCGAATTLTVGGTSLDNGLTILAGSRLPNLPAVPAQARPSPNILHYMEPNAPTDFANCIFKGIGTPITPIYNDRLLPIQ